MADNYLERRMDDYRSGRLKSSRRRAVKARALFITDGLSEDGVRSVRKHCSHADCAVAFAGLPMNEGYALAQATGSRYYPTDPTDAEAMARAIEAARIHYAPLEMTVIKI